MSDHYSTCPACGHALGAPRCDTCKDSGYVTTVVTADHMSGITLDRCPNGCTSPVAINTSGLRVNPTWVMSVT